KHRVDLNHVSIEIADEYQLAKAGAPSFVISIDNCFLSQRITASFKSPTMKGAFPSLSEYGKPNAMQEIASPEFDRLSYAIEDYAGFLPVPNDLLDDTDQALESYLRQWIAKKSIATR
ncbi:phage major capsid protein, partial [Escherichia sp. TWPC-MK]